MIEAKATDFQEKTHRPRMHLQNFQTFIPSREITKDQTIKPSRSQESSINQLRLAAQSDKPPHKKMQYLVTNSLTLTKKKNSTAFFLCKLRLLSKTFNGWSIQFTRIREKELSSTFQPFGKVHSRRAEDYCRNCNIYHVCTELTWQLQIQILQSRFPHHLVLSRTAYKQLNRHFDVLVSRNNNQPRDCIIFDASRQLAT